MRAKTWPGLFPAALLMMSMVAAACGAETSGSETAAQGFSRYQSAGDETSEVVSVEPDGGGPQQDDESEVDGPQDQDRDNDRDNDRDQDEAADGSLTDPDADRLPTSAAEAVEALDRAEMAVRDPMIEPTTRAAWGRRQQALYRHLSNNEEWAETVLAEVDPSIKAAVVSNWTARQNLAALLNTEELHSELPAWRITEPRPADELIGYYKDGEAAWGIPWEFLAAINLIETRMGRIQGVSTAGALGPMQFLPTTWDECCDGDPTDPADAIVGAAKYLTIRGGPDNMDRAIWGYNNSDYYVNAVTAYADVLMADEQAYHGYHAWEVYFLSTEGLVRIPVGYEQQEPIAVSDWLADNPDALFSR